MSKILENKTKELLIVTGLDRLVKILPSFISLFVGLSVLAYLIGWLSAAAYFREFGAEWLVPELSPSSLLAFSWPPLAALAVLGFIAISELIESDGRSTWASRTMRIGFRVILVVTVGGGIAAYYLSDGFLSALGYVDALLAVLVAGTSIEVLILWLGRHNAKLDGFALFLLVSVVFSGIFNLPVQFGHAIGRIDHSQTSTSLPLIRLKGSDSRDFRMLLLHGDRAYLFVDAPAVGKPEIFSVRVDDILSIRSVR